MICTLAIINFLKFPSLIHLTYPWYMPRIDSFGGQKGEVVSQRETGIRSISLGLILKNSA